MTLAKLADKIISKVYKQYLETGNLMSATKKIQLEFPDESFERICDAVRLLDKDGFFSAIQYGDDRPLIFYLDIEIVRDFDEDTLLRKGYHLLKEIRELLG